MKSKKGKALCLELLNNQSRSLVSDRCRASCDHSSRQLHRFRVSVAEKWEQVWYDASRKRPVLDTPASGLQATTLRVVPAATMVSESESDPSHCAEGVIFLCVQTLHDRMFGVIPSER